MLVRRQLSHLPKGIVSATTRGTQLTNWHNSCQYAPYDLMYLHTCLYIYIHTCICLVYMYIHKLACVYTIYTLDYRIYCVLLYTVYTVFICLYIYMHAYVDTDVCVQLLIVHRRPDFGTKPFGILRGHPNHGSTVDIDPQYGLKVMNGYETHMDCIHQTSELNWWTFKPPSLTATEAYRGEETISASARERRTGQKPRPLGPQAVTSRLNGRF